MTPELFAEYREGEELDPQRPHNIIKEAYRRLPTVDLPPLPLPPGPAFIPALDLAYRTTDPDYFRSQYRVPEGYVWQPSTESTGAGWVRPLGKPVT